MKQFHQGACREDLGRISRLFKRRRTGSLAAGLCAALFLLPAFTFGKEPSADVKKSPALTEEEKEIIKELELLENFVLLQDLDAIDFLDILSEMNPDWAEEAEPAGQTDRKEGGVSK